MRTVYERAVRTEVDAGILAGERDRGAPDVDDPVARRPFDLRRRTAAVQGDARAGPDREALYCAVDRQPTSILVFCRIGVAAREGEIGHDRAAADIHAAAGFDRDAACLRVSVKGHAGAGFQRDLVRRAFAVEAQFAVVEGGAVHLAAGGEDHGAMIYRGPVDRAAVESETAFFHRKVVDRAAAGGENDASLVDQEVVDRAAVDVHAAGVTDAGAVHFAALGDEHAAAGGDRGFAGDAAIGNVHAAAGGDRGFDRFAAFEDEHRVVVQDLVDAGFAF